MPAAMWSRGSATGLGVLIVGDTGCLKKGVRSASPVAPALGHRTDRLTENCQIGVLLAYASGHPTRSQHTSSLRVGDDEGESSV